MLALALLAALALDAAIGDPRFSAHPVRLVGHLAQGLERVLYRPGHAGLATGLVFALLVPLLASLGLATLFQLAMPWAGSGVDVVLALLSALTLWACLAFRDLFDHVRPIVGALEAEDLGEARAAVQRIVGRDAALLDAHGVARAAVESVAESLSDGVVGPLVCFTAAGVAAAGLGAPAPYALFAAAAGALVFRTVNTLDSTVGYRNERYLAFGRASARFDDLLGLVPSRLSVVFLSLAALLLRFDVSRGLRTWWRDGGKHPSPNAGQGESFVAGALDLALGGPTAYRHGVVPKDWLGDGRPDVTAADLHRACRLVRGAGWLAGAACATVLAALPLIAGTA